MKWFSVVGTGGQVSAVEVESATVYMYGMTFQNQGNAENATGVLIGAYGHAMAELVSNSMDGYKWGIKNGQYGQSSLNTCEISNCTVGVYAVASTVFLYAMTYTGTQTNKQSINYARIYDSNN